MPGAMIENYRLQMPLRRVYYYPVAYSLPMALTFDNYVKLETVSKRSIGLTMMMSSNKTNIMIKYNSCNVFQCGYSKAFVCFFNSQWYIKAKKDYLTAHKDLGTASL